jgi:hypothetical protein
MASDLSTPIWLFHSQSQDRPLLDEKK